MGDFTAVERLQNDLLREELCDEIVCRMQSRMLGRLLRYLHDHPADAEPILRRVFLVYCDWLADGHPLDPRTRMALETYRGFVEGFGDADTLTLARKQAKIAARALRKEDRGPASVSRFIARYVREASRNNAWESWYHVVGHRGDRDDIRGFDHRLRQYFTLPQHATRLALLARATQRSSRYSSGSG